jgi:Tfp pilus assembly protein PilO
VAEVTRSSTNALIVAMLLAAALAAGFWMLVLSPKREQVAELEDKVSAVRASLAQHRVEVAEGEQARREFPHQYRRLIVLGKAVPGDDDVASLLVQFNRIGEGSGTRFSEIELQGEGGEEAKAPAGTPSEPVPPTEAEASLMPLGAEIGPAGLAVMPYSLQFEGDFFEIADFLAGLDGMVETEEGGQVVVDGRLVTIDGFTLEADEEIGFPALEAGISVTTFLTPPADGTGLELPPTAPPSSAVPAAATTGGTP